jgi:hypothetical protein
MNGQLQLPLIEVETNGKPKRGGSLPRGPRGLLMALQREGLNPDALEPAARLIALLDEDAGGKR